jgi:hypothetical protein
MAALFSHFCCVSSPTAPFLCHPFASLNGLPFYVILSDSEESPNREPDASPVGSA